MTMPVMRITQMGMGMEQHLMAMPVAVLFVEL
jgi:hypothetical protein